MFDKHLEKEISEKYTFKPLGCSLVEYPPVFTKDTKYIYTIWNNVIRLYSTSTGELIQEFLGIKGSPIIGLLLNPQNEQIFVACSKSGHIAQWIQEDSYNIKSQQLDIKKDWSIKWFDLFFHEKKNKIIVFIGYEIINEENLFLASFSLENGSHIETFDLWARNCKHSISLGKQILASVSNNKLFLINPTKKNKASKSVTVEKNLFCVSVGGDGSLQHPTLVAAGNIEGVILIWNEPLLNNSPPAYYHWHPIVPNCLHFSNSASKLFSGGKEKVFVLWTLGVKKPYFLPRLSSEIYHITLSHDNRLAALALADNSIHIISLQDIKITAVIQHLTVPKIPVLCLEPNSKGLVLGGREGQLQIYNPQTNSTLYHLDITMINQVTKVDDQVLKRPEITCVAFNFDKKWLVTAEQSIDAFEARIKFWRINGSKFTLVTSVDHPHHGGIKSLASSPTHNIFVSCGADSKFRIWQNIEENSGWRCLNIGMYRDYSCQTANFSIDGSILGIAFGPTLTLWAHSEMNIRATLTPANVHRNEKATIRHLIFGGKDRFHLVGTSSQLGLFVWDILSLTVLWHISLEISYLFSDLNNDRWAIFASQYLYIFDPIKPKPEQKVKWPHNIPPVSATFGIDSQIFVLDNNFNLYKLEDENDVNSKKAISQILFQEHIPETRYSKMIAEQYTSEVKKNEQTEHKILGNYGQTAIKKFLSAPAHTMPGMNMFCKNFLSSFITIPRKPESKEEEEEIEEFTLSSEDESDTIVKKVKNIEESKDEFVDISYDKSQLENITRQPMDWVDLLS